MNEAIIPAVVAASGGGALAATIAVYEARTEAAMRASRVRFGLTFPAGTDALHAKVALSGLAGGIDRLEYVFEVSATDAGVTHQVLVPAAVRASVVATLTGALPGLRVTEVPAPSGRATLAATVFVPTPSVLLTENAEGATRTLIAGISGLSADEQAAVKWAIRPGLPRRFDPKEPLDRVGRDVERAWRHKVSGSPGFQAAGLVIVRAASIARARQILEHLTSSIRSRRGPVGALRITTERGSRSMAALPKTTSRSGWLATGELVGGLLGWPLGSDPISGVERDGARQLAVPRYVPTEGRRLFVGRDSTGNPRPVAWSPQAASAHLGLLGKTGSGKTTVLIQIILAALTEGVGGVFLDPKDAIPTLLNHIPAELADRVVVIDLGQPGPIAGLDLFGAGDDPVMRSDVILSVLKGVSDGWGPRIQRFLTLGLRSISVLSPSPVLFDWIRLYAEPEFRREVVAKITDPVIAAEWRTYEESLSSAQQHEFVAPALARVTELLSRPALRATLSQPEPKVNIGRLLAEGTWLLIALSPGTVGEIPSILLASVATYLMWVAVERRAVIPPAKRHQVMLVLDELQSLSHLPVRPEVFFQRLRSLNCCVVAATQAASALPESTRAALFANAGSLLTFAGGADEAQRIAREVSPLTAADIMGFRRYEIGGRVSTGSRGPGSAVVTGRTEPLPPPTNQAARIRRLSAERYGRDPREIEEALRQRSKTTTDGSYGRTGRAA